MQQITVTFAFQLVFPRGDINIDALVAFARKFYRSKIKLRLSNRIIYGL